MKWKRKGEKMFLLGILKKRDIFNLFDFEADAQTFFDDLKAGGKRKETVHEMDNP